MKIKSYVVGWIRGWIKTVLRTILVQLVAWTLGLLLMVGLGAGAYFYVKNLVQTKTPSSLHKLAEVVVSSKNVVLEEKKMEPAPPNQGQKFLQAFPQLGSFLQASNLVSAGKAYDAVIEARHKPVAPLELRKDQPDGELLNSRKREDALREPISVPHGGQEDPSETVKNPPAKIDGTGTLTP